MAHTRSSNWGPGARHFRWTVGIDGRCAAIARSGQRCLEAKARSCCCPAYEHSDAELWALGGEKDKHGAVQGEEKTAEVVTTCVLMPRDLQNNSTPLQIVEEISIESTLLKGTATSLNTYSNLKLKYNVICYCYICLKSD